MAFLAGSKVKIQHTGTSVCTGLLLFQVNFLALPFTMTSDEAITPGTSVGVSGLHVMALEYLVFGSNLIHGNYFTDGGRTVPF